MMNLGKKLYFGEWLNKNKHNGISYYSDNKVKYIGQWRDGAYDGYGIFFDESGDKLYSGKFKGGYIITNDT